MVRGFPAAVAALLAVLLSGCVTPTWIRSEPPPGPPVTVLASREPAKVSTALVFAFPMKGTQKGEGALVAERLAEALTAEKYAASVRVDRRVPASGEEAAKFAREAGADAAVTGDVEEFFFGGRSTASHVRMSVRVFDPAAVRLDWHLVSSLSDSPRPPRDRYFFVDRGEEARSPMSLAEDIIREMARILAGRPAKPAAPAIPESKPDDQGAPRDAGAFRTY